MDFPPALPYPRTMATHLGAVLLGGLAFWGISPAEDRSGANETDHQRWRSTDRAERSGATTGTLLLQEMTRDLPPPLAGASPEGARPTGPDQQNADADALPPASDVRAAAISCLSSFKEEYSPKEFSETQSRLLHWMRADPEGMIGYVCSLEKPQPYGNSSYLMSQILNAAVQRAGAGAALGWMRNNPAFSETFAEQMAPHFGAAGDVRQLEAFSEHLGPAWDNIRDEALKAWPIEKGDELIGFLEESPDLIIQYASMKSDGGAKWLLEVLKSGKLDEVTRQALETDVQFRNLLVFSSAMPAELRIREIMRLDPAQSEAEIRRRVIANDVMNALNSGPDLRYAFRHGRITGEQVYQDIASRLPGLAGASSAALRRQIYQELAEEDPQAAMTILKDLPPDARQDAITRAPLDMFGDMDPQRLYDFLQTIPTDGNDAAWNTRLQTWEERTYRNQERLGNDYITWVKQLPPGTDREMALVGLITNEYDQLPPAEAQDLAKEIRDPKLLARLEEVRKKREEEGQ